MVSSVVITYHNEGQTFLEECISQVRSTIHFTPEIIVVDDCSRVPLNPIDVVRIIRHDTQKGVGAAMDTGIDNATHENIIFMACDIRLADNGWADKMLNEIELHPRSIACTTCIGLNAENMDITLRRDHHWSGATILIFHDSKSNPRKKPNFRGLVEAKWLPYKGGESYEVPCILGACYAVKKSWYKYIDGFWGHKLWSNLEPLISIKSYLFGGSCRVVPEAETGHIFKPSGTHDTPQEALVYNKILISKLLFPDSDRLINFLGLSTSVIKAQQLIKPNLVEIEKKRQEYLSKTTFTIEEYVKKFSIDYRK